MPHLLVPAIPTSGVYSLTPFCLCHGTEAECAALSTLLQLPPSRGTVQQQQVRLGDYLGAAVFHT